MKIKILGTRGNIKIEAPGHRLHSGLLIDDRIMLDLGENQFLDHKPELVLITHLHPDHAYFIEDKNIKPAVPVYAPEPYKQFPELQVIKEPLHWKDYSIYPLPVSHSLNVKSVGYVIQKEDESIFYTGDVAAFDTTLVKPFGKQAMIITEASFIKKGGLIRYKDGQPYGHLGIPDLIDLFKPYTNKIALTHFGSWFVKDVEAGTKKIKALETSALTVLIGKDGANLC